MLCNFGDVLSFQIRLTRHVFMFLVRYENEIVFNELLLLIAMGT